MSDIPESIVEWTVQAFTNGINTAEMARCWHRRGIFTEADCERALHIGLERRRLARAMVRLADEMGANV